MQVEWPPGSGTMTVWPEIDRAGFFTLQAARDLYGAGSDVERAIGQAWTAVGVQ